MNDLFNQLSPKLAFWSGVVTAVMVVSTIGFIILLTLFFQGKTFHSLAVNNEKVVTDRAVPTPYPPSPSVPSAPKPVAVAAVTEDDHIRGSIEAPIKIIEYSDTECPFCKRFHPTLKQIFDQYEGEVAWVYRHFPLDSLHRKARPEAEATECVAELGGNDVFWEYLDRIYEETPSNDGLPASRLPELAEEVGVDRAKFVECVDSGRHVNTVQAHYDSAIAAGGTGTPYSVIVSNSQTIPLSGALPASEIAAAINALR